MSQDNPYSAPQAELHESSFNRRDAWYVIGYGAVLGASLGIVTNAINGWLGPVYFAFVMRWQNPIWIKAVSQGAVEGAIYGILSAAVLTGVALYQKRPKLFDQKIRRTMYWVAGTVFVFWVIGGTFATLYLPHHQPAPGTTIFPWLAFGDRGFCWTIGSLNLAVMASPIITTIFAVKLYRENAAD
jgi:hypothetical protein